MKVRVFIMHFWSESEVDKIRVVAEGVGLRAEAYVVKRDLEQQVASSRDATSACLAIACVTRHCTQNSHRE